jgi:hypothetical protein
VWVLDRLVEATGPFTFLPIHAAATTEHAVLDRVVSSYMPIGRTYALPQSEVITLEPPLQT